MLRSGTGVRAGTDNYGRDSPKYSPKSERPGSRSTSAIVTDPAIGRFGHLVVPKFQLGPEGERQLRKGGIP
jgi:hypothetical protein